MYEEKSVRVRWLVILNWVGENDHSDFRVAVGLGQGLNEASLR